MTKNTESSDYLESGPPHTLREKQICFLHIRKTAGTSVHHFLRAALPDVRTFHSDPKGFDDAQATDLCDYGLLLGHFSFDHVKKFRSPNFLITFLRNPVERVLSSYYHMRESWPVDNPNSPISLAQRFEIEAFLQIDSHAIRMFTSNHLCYTLTKDWRAERNLDTRILVSQALENLGQFAFVGFVENFTSDIKRLSHLLGCPPPPQHYHLNRTLFRRARSELSPRIIGLIEELNAGDIELYNQILRNIHGR